MDRYYSSEITGSSITYKIPNSTQLNARQRRPDCNCIKRRKQQQQQQQQQQQPRLLNTAPHCLCEIFWFFF